MSQDLLTRALKKAGTGRALGHAIGKAEQRISHYKHGKEPMPDEVIAALAVYLGDDPIDALARERGGTWERVARAMREKISVPFDWLLSHANPRGALFFAG